MPTSLPSQRPTLPQAYAILTLMLHASFAWPIVGDGNDRLDSNIFVDKARHMFSTATNGWDIPGSLFKTVQAQSCA